MSLKSYLADAAEMLENETGFEGFELAVTSAFKKHFPNGYINVQKRKSLGGDEDHIVGYIGMIGNIKDNSGGYHDNDNMKHTFFMYPTKEAGVYSFKGSGRISINPEEGSYMAMGSVKTKFGNASKVTLDKAEKKIVKFFGKLAGLMKDNIDNIYRVETINKKYLIIK